MNGTGEFTSNFGSVIQAEESDVYLYGSLSFINNTGENGGAIRIEGNSALYLIEGLNASFVNNYAYKFGGAIYVNSNSFRKCAIQPLMK